MTSYNVGIIGCGSISHAYLSKAKDLPILKIAAVADLNRAAAEKRASEFGVPRVLTVDELLADPDIQLVLNLTIPAAHADISMKALSAGKHVYLEKPLAVNRADGERVMKLAAEKGLRVGCAPDTFLGAAHQTARKLIDDGAIGRPVSFTIHMMGRGHETWHPSPEFYYQPGGGPMFDMGPYYLTQLTHMLGPVKRLAGAAAIAISDRTITSQPLYGKKIDVQTEDHIVGMMEMENGAIGTIVMSFAITGNTNHYMTVFGTEGAMYCADPNSFDGPYPKEDGTSLRIRKQGDKEAQLVPYEFPTGYGRAAGLADMADAIAKNRPHRVSGDLAMYVLDLMAGFYDSGRTSQFYTPTAKYVRPEPLPYGQPFGTF